MASQSRGRMRNLSLDRFRLSRPRPEEEPPPFDPHDLAGLFATPPWLRDVGTSSWFAVGVGLFVAGLIWLAAMTQTIVMPVITAAIIAAVAGPVVGWLEGKGIKRGIGTALLMLGLVVAGVLVVLLVVGGITSEKSALSSLLSSAKDTIAGWSQDLGVDAGSANAAKEDVTTALKDGIPALLHGLAGGLETLSSLVVFLAFTTLSLFFLLIDGPHIRHWLEGHMRVPRPVAHGMGQRVLQSLRGYFVGVTIVAVFNAVVVGLGALIIGVPLAGTIAVVTFLGAYIPYLGAWTAGTFAVLIALGSSGTDAAVGMIVVQLLANGILQQMIQPIAYGAALGIHPLAVLIVTIAGGALFGTIGLILAAPLTSAGTRIAGDLARNRPEEPVPEPQPAASVP
jgi:putative heme transporter